jgi:hypothetical protein
MVTAAGVATVLVLSSLWLLLVLKLKLQPAAGTVAATTIVELPPLLGVVVCLLLMGSYKGFYVVTGEQTAIHSTKRTENGSANLPHPWGWTLLQWPR